MVRYAGFWRRFAAYLIDGLLMGAAILVVFIVLGLLGASAAAAGGEAGAAAALSMLLFVIPFLVVGGWLYFALMESSVRQGTLGKMAIGIKVTDLNGNRLSFGRATGRHFAKIVTSLIPLAIGWMLAGWTAKKQALHDMMASCLVVCRE
jgi:uncharacterized RDD family membrane protein YckC